MDGSTKYLWGKAKNEQDLWGKVNKQEKTKIDESYEARWINMLEQKID